MYLWGVQIIQFKSRKFDISLKNVWDKLWFCWVKNSVSTLKEKLLIVKMYQSRQKDRSG